MARVEELPALPGAVMTTDSPLVGRSFKITLASGHYFFGRVIAVNDGLAEVEDLRQHNKVFVPLMSSSFEQIMGGVMR